MGTESEYEDAISPPLPRPLVTPEASFSGPGAVPRNILVCLDRSALGESGLPYAVALARQWGARLTLLHVLEPLRHGGGDAGSAGAMPADALGWEVSRAEAHHYLDELRKRIAGAGVPTDIKLVQGRAAEQILHQARLIKSDLTVLASHGERGPSEWFLSSTASKVVARSFGSVLIIPAHPVEALADVTIRLRRILAPLDGSLRAESALPIVVRAARQYGAEVILLHAIATPELTCRARATVEERELAERLKERNERAATTYLEGIRQRLAAEGVSARVLVVDDGDVRQKLVETSESERVDLTILTAHGSTGSCRYPYGIVAEHFLARGSSPLLVIQDLSRVELERCLHRDRKAPERFAGSYHVELK